MSMKMAMMQALLMSEMSNSIMSRESIASSGCGYGSSSKPAKQGRNKKSKRKIKMQKQSRKKNR